MNGKSFSIGVGFLLSMSGACFGAAPLATGTVHFKGSITAPACSATSHNNLLKFNSCSTETWDQDINAHESETLYSVKSINTPGSRVKLVSKRTDTKAYNDREYSLVDDTGSSVSTGIYIVILTAL